MILLSLCYNKYVIERRDTMRRSEYTPGYTNSDRMAYWSLVKFVNPPKEYQEIIEDVVGWDKHLENLQLFQKEIKQRIDEVRKDRKYDGR